MREILFRGKTVHTDSKWVEGFYVHVPCGRFLCDEHMIQTVEEDGRIGQLYDVYESTVGQFTGLTDKNGKKIFEGDVIKAIGSDIAGDDIEATVVVNLDDYELMWDIEHSHEVKIIGNIYDNPELLEARQ